MKLSALAEARSDVFHLDRKMIVTRDGFNIRTDYGDLKSYAKVIRESGVKRPIIGHKNDADQFEVTEGHRTLRAFDMAAEEMEEDLRKARIDENRTLVTELNALKKENLSTIPVCSEPQGYTDKERIFDMFTYNEGKPLTILEEGIGYQRLMKDHSVSEADILRKTGKSKTAFQNCMMLINDGAPALIDAVRDGVFSPSLAVELVRKIKDKQQQVVLVAEAIARAKAAGKSAVSAKHLDEDTRGKVAPSKKTASRSNTSTHSGGGSGAGSGSSPSAGPAPAPAPKQPTVKKEVTDATMKPIAFPKGVKIEAQIHLGKVNGGPWIVAVKMRYLDAKELTGTDLDPEGVTFTSMAAAEVEGYNMINDNLLAAQRTDKKFATRAKIADALAAMKKIIAKAAGEAKKAEGAPIPPEDKTKDHAGQESLSLAADELDADPAAHILRLRGVLRDDKRMKNKKGHASYVSLNFIADYLEGNRYTPEQFEKFFTEFILTGKQ